MLIDGGEFVGDLILKGNEVLSISAHNKIIKKLIEMSVLKTISQAFEQPFLKSNFRKDINSPQ